MTKSAIEMESPKSHREAEASSMAAASAKIPRIVVCAVSMVLASKPPCPIIRYQLDRSEEHTSELQSLMRISYAVFCLKKKNESNHTNTQQTYMLNTTTS